MNESNLSDEALAELLSLNVGVNGNGTTMYRNHLGQLHRTLGPAVILVDGGGQLWYQNGRRHRTDGPAVVDDNGYREWWLNGEHLTEREWDERIKSL